jgi:hypothetical protein
MGGNLTSSDAEPHPEIILLPDSVDLIIWWLFSNLIFIILQT